MKLAYIFQNEAQTDPLVDRSSALLTCGHVAKIILFLIGANSKLMN